LEAREPVVLMLLGAAVARAHGIEVPELVACPGPPDE
jgi:hypothetical protein